MEIRSTKKITGQTTMFNIKTGEPKTEITTMIQTDVRRPIIRSVNLVYRKKTELKIKLAAALEAQDIMQSEMLILKSYKRHLKKLIKRNKGA